MTDLNTQHKEKKLSRWISIPCWALFTVWHIIFVIVAVFLFIPHIVFPSIQYAMIGASNWSQVFYWCVVIIVPFISLYLVFRYLRHSIKSVLLLFYAVEVPLLLMIVLKVLLLRESTYWAMIILALFLASILLYACQLGYRFVPKWQTLLNSKGIYLDNHSKLALLCSTLIAVTGLYLGILLGLYFAPFLVEFIAGIINEILSGFDDFSLKGIYRFFVFLLGSALFFMLFFLLLSTFLFFLLTPFVLIFVYCRQFWVCCKSQSLTRIGIACFLVIFSGCLLFLSPAQNQSQLYAFQLTEFEPTTDQDRLHWLSQTEAVRVGLLNAYLGAYRYVSTTGTSRLLTENYEKAFGHDASGFTELAQTLFNTLASPFLFQGDNFEEAKQLAAQRYQQYFDTHIEKAEKTPILKAVKTTWSSEGSEAGLINVDSRYVKLFSQTISVENKRGIATVSVLQHFKNETFDDQEVVMHFSLPEDAVVTGLWLSDDEDHPEKFKHVVSPRGAAQSVYKAEVNRQIDPALIEKVGPQQYRLRAFPIPAKEISHKNDHSLSHLWVTDIVKPATVKFEYSVSLDSEGYVALPQLLEKRNVYWDNTMVRSHDVSHGEDWLPKRVSVDQSQIETVDKASSQEVQELTYQTMVDGVVIKAESFGRAEGFHHRFVQNSMAEPIMVVIDGSFSMNRWKDQLRSQIRMLEQQKIAYELVFCQQQCRHIQDPISFEPVFFGNSQLIEQWLTFTESSWFRHTQKNGSAIYWLTDAGSYELTAQFTQEQKEQYKKVLKNIQKPLWLVHISDSLPYAYGDEMIDALVKSHGGISRSLESAIIKNAFRQNMGTLVDGQVLLEATDDFIWYQGIEGEELAEQEQARWPNTFSRPALG